MGVLVPIIGIIVIFGSPAFIIFFLARYRHEQKMEMIRRGINPSTHTISYQGAISLLFGLLLTFLGIAAIISIIILFVRINQMPGYHAFNPIFLLFGLLILASGLALLVYWKLTAPERERMRRLFEERFTAEKASSPKTIPQPSCPDTESPAPGGAGQSNKTENESNNPKGAPPVKALLIMVSLGVLYIVAAAHYITTYIA